MLWRTHFSGPLPGSGLHAAPRTASLCKHFLLCLLLLLCTDLPAAAAQEGVPRYRVEALIFAVADPRAAAQEYWRPGENTYFPARLVHLDAASSASGTVTSKGQVSTSAPAPVSAPLSIMRLPMMQARLSAARERLEAQGEFRILFHALWEQPVYKADAAPHVLVRGGQEYGRRRELEGLLQLSLSRYLHLETDLRLSTYRKGRQGSSDWPLPAAPPLPDTDAELPAGRIRQVVQVLEGLWQEASNDLMVLRTVHMRQHRRMRSNELHYLDHPLLGMLVLVYPADTKEQ